MVKLQQIIDYWEKPPPRNTNPSGYWRVCFCLHSDLVSIEKDVCFDLMPAQSCPREPGCQNQLRRQSREMQVKFPQDGNMDSVEKSCSQKAVCTVSSLINEFRPRRQCHYNYSHKLGDYCHPAPLVLFNWKVAIACFLLWYEFPGIFKNSTLSKWSIMQFPCIINTSASAMPM